jgi:AcrR family transcriptional regulator
MPSASKVPEIQRARLIRALVEVTHERGVGQVTVAHVVARAGVSRRTFYELFEDREACLLAALDQAIEHIGTRVVPVFDQARGSWSVRMRAALLELLAVFDEEPGFGRMCVVDALSAGAPALQRRTRVVRALVDAVDGGRLEAKAGLQPSRLTAEGVVGGVLAVLYERLAEPAARGIRLVESLNPLMAMIVLPYLGAAAASKQLTRPQPTVPRPAETTATPANPLAGLEMRLTYRTTRVLGAIAAGPGASNREVAQVAGVHDPGQISKLLARLEQLGLVENASRGSIRGVPNAWRLTRRGGDVEGAIRECRAPLQTAH